MSELPGRDQPDGPALLALAREVLLRELSPLLPAERRLDALLVASSMAIAEREAMAGQAEPGIAAELEQFYQTESATEPPPRPFPVGTGEGRTRVSGGACPGPDPGVEAEADLLRRFAADLRRGEFETEPERERAARAILWQMTLSRLRLANPRFLAANGFG